MSDVGHLVEVPMYFNMPSSRTIDFSGVKMAKALTTGHEKLRFAFALTIVVRIDRYMGESIVEGHWSGFGCKGDG